MLSNHLHFPFIHDFVLSVDLTYVLYLPGQDDKTAQILVLSIPVHLTNGKLLYKLEPYSSETYGMKGGDVLNHSSKVTACLHARLAFTSSNLLTSLDSRFTIWPVVVFPIAALLRHRAWGDTDITKLIIANSINNTK